MLSDKLLNSNATAKEIIQWQEKTNIRSDLRLEDFDKINLILIR